MRCLMGVVCILLSVGEFVLAGDLLVYEGTSGPGKGRHVVCLTGDEEYRSEEALVQLARILAFRHGFRATVLFAIDPDDGTINPNVNDSLPHADELGTADAIVMGLRFRDYPDEVMQHFVDAYLAGKPIVAVRTSTHAFKYASQSESRFKDYSHNSQGWPGGFGRQVLGETWVAHLGKNHKEATLGIAADDASNHPVMSGVGDIFATSGAYAVDPMDDSVVLMRAQVLAGMTPDSPLESTGKNNPLQPVAWVREHKNAAGKVNRVLCTTMGAATDLADEDLRRLLVNGVYWGLEMDVPQSADVRIVGEYEPTDYGFSGFRKGVKPSDLAMTAEAFFAEE
ncbi:MAG: ThuA domain-containing protein [Planctomycetota bacterium]